MRSSSPSKPGFTNKVIAYPTETTYGLGCDPRDTKAVRRVFRMKGRPDGKPVLLIAASMAQVNTVVDLSRLTPAARKTFAALTKKYWPGPVTLVLPAKRGIGLSRLIVPKQEVAIRVTSSPFAARVARSYGFPVVSTSANRSGQPPALCGKAVARAFANGPKPDHILDAGYRGSRKPSTIARIRPDGSIEVLRQGVIRLKILV